MAALAIVGVLALAFVLHWGPARGSPGARAAVLAVSGVCVLALLAWSAWPNDRAAVAIAAMLAAAVVTLGLARRQLRRRSRRDLAVAVAVAVAGYGAAIAALRVGHPEASPSLVVPMSLGMLMLRQIHLAYEAHRRHLAPIDLRTWLAYLFFAPTIVAGPLERLATFRRQLAAPFETANVSVAAERLLAGAFKKLVVADVVLASLLPPAEVAGRSFDGIAWPAVVFACAVRLLHLYYDFAGYTDMARGVARLFGFELIANFDRPFHRPTLAAFWRSWHISLSTFVRDHLYLPLLAKTRRPAVAMAATMVAIGLWHGVAVGWLLWALHHALGLVVLARWQRRAQAMPAFQRWRTGRAWTAAAFTATWLYLAAGSAFLWRPADPWIGLRVYTKFWTFGLAG